MIKYLCPLCKTGEMHLEYTATDCTIIHYLKCEKCGCIVNEDADHTIYVTPLYKGK
jgi:hypothetical protein